MCPSSTFPSPKLEFGEQPKVAPNIRTMSEANCPSYTNSRPALTSRPRSGAPAQGRDSIPLPGLPGADGEASRSTRLFNAGHVLNNPVKYQDPSGNCPRPPEGWGPAICVSLFIAPGEVSAGPFRLHGDGRGFQSDSDPGASRGYIWISPDGSKYEPHMNSSAYIFPASSSGHDFEWWVEPSDSNSWTVTTYDGGYITIDFDLVIAGILDESGSAPHINGSITFHVNADGTISYSFSRDGFPWAEAYYYDENGNVITIFQDPAVRGEPQDLFAIEPGLSWPASWVETVQSWIIGDPSPSEEDALCYPGEPC